MKNHSDQEIEVKFYINDLAAIQNQLISEAAKLVQERCFEANLRFDQQDHALGKDRRVLRLRKDTQSILTYKGPAEMGKTVSIRQEIEVVVDDFDTTRRLLEGLGYHVYMTYEKYRAMYSYHKVIVTLDEITVEVFNHLVTLAALELDESQAVYLRHELNQQLKAINELAAIPLEDDLRISAHGVSFTSESSPQLRKDDWLPFEGVNEILSQAPQTDSHFIVVPDIPHEKLD